MPEPARRGSVVTSKDAPRPTNDGGIAIGRPNSPGELPETLRALGLTRPLPVLVIVGGAGSVDEKALERLGPLFSSGIAPLAEALGAAVVDGGTDAGVMRLIGQARGAIAGTFPLIGVAPVDKVMVPGTAASSDIARVEPHHTHVILVPATNWAAGAPWLSAVVNTLSGEERAVTVLIGGGDVSWIDATVSVTAGRPLVAVRGTGGVADTLAGALDSETGNAQAAAIAASGLLTTVDFADGPTAVAAAVSRALASSL
jgi:hypothetical protein